MKILLLPLIGLICLSCNSSTLEWSVDENIPRPDFSTLPRGIRLAGESESPDWCISSRSVRSPIEPKLAISRDFIVPAVSWLDERQSVSSVDLLSGNLQLIPLEKLSLPEKLLAVDGFYPGDEPYPLVDWTVLEVESSGSERRKERLDAWLHLEAARGLESDRNTRLDPNLYRLAAVGDLMPGRGFGELLTGPEGVEEALGDVAPLLSEADLLIGNLETAVTESNDAVEKSYNFKVSSNILDAVVALGFDYYHLANNHGWDYGEAGFRDTLDAVASTDVGFSGAGLDIDEARFVWNTRMPDGTAIRILSLGAYYPERNGFDGSMAAAAGEGKPGVLWDSPENEDFIRSALTGDDAFTIVTVHGGYEWEDSPRDEVKALYRRYVDWGADLVLAHHPHVLQGMELYEGSIIAYSLGNFIFPGMTGWYTGEETGVLEMYLYDGRIIGVDFRPVLIDNMRLRRADGNGIAERFWEMSSELATEVP